MNAAFDTLTAAKQLLETGLKQDQAEAIALVVKNGQGEMASKQDLDALERKMDSQFTSIRWIIGLMVALQIATLTAVLAILI
ncbi:MAG: hypothetical protein OXE83_07270 [Gammaproteobacteria bacterium]|nr:hypothetical protein [Gammaproteobacteria bacterium]